MTNSCAKGKRGEREFAGYLREKGLPARRGQQFSGSTDSPDVVCVGLTDVHFEVKRTQVLDAYDYVEQAVRDAGPKNLPVVAFRRNREPWLAILPMDQMIELLKLREGFKL